MLKINKIRKSIAEQREIERLKAEILRLRAENDYIAMMCDIDLSGAEEEDKNEN